MPEAIQTASDPLEEQAADVAASHVWGEDFQEMVALA
jgi:hypothetical protein